MLKILLISLLLANCSGNQNNKNNQDQKKQNKTLNEKEIVEILEKGTLEEIKKIVNKDNVNNIYEYRFSVLHEAVERGNLELVKYLLNIQGIDTNLIAQNLSPLSRAVTECLVKKNKKESYQDNLEIVKLLVNKGANVHSEKLDMYTDPFYLALNGSTPPYSIKGVQFDILEIFLEKDFKISFNDEISDIKTIFIETIPATYELEENTAEDKKERLDKIIMAFFDKISFDNEIVTGVYMGFIINIQNPVLLEYMIDKKIPFSLQYLRYVVKNATNEEFKEIGNKFLNSRSK